MRFFFFSKVILPVFFIKIIHSVVSLKRFGNFRDCDDISNYETSRRKLQLRRNEDYFRCLKFNRVWLL